MSNYIDTRDLYQRKCELEDLRDALKDAKEELEAARQELDSFENDGSDDAQQEYNALEQAVEKLDELAASAEQDFDTPEQDELAELENLESEISDFRDGETMIPETQFQDYAEQLAEECGDYNSRDVKWPFTCIDWEQAAKELAMDYSTVTYQGTDYYVRS